MSVAKTSTNTRRTSAGMSEVTSNGAICLQIRRRPLIWVRLVLDRDNLRLRLIYTGRWRTTSASPCGRPLTAAPEHRRIKAIISIQEIHLSKNLCA